MTTIYADLRWPPATGIGVVCQEVLRRLPKDLSVSPLRTTTRIGSPLSPVALSWALAEARAQTGAFWSAGFVPPITSRVPRVVTVHDLTHLHFYSFAHTAYYRAVYKPIFRSVERLICVSKYTADELCEWCGLDSTRVHVIHNGVSARFHPRVGKRPAQEHAPYILYAGNRRKYKNLRRLIQAFAISRLAEDGFRLELTGTPDPDLHELARDLDCAKNLVFSGNLDDDKLADRYASAHGIAFVSLYEGFGLPILEGMASGVPVLTSNVSSMPEIAGDAAIIVNPYSTEDIAAGLRRLCLDSDARSRCVEQGFQRAGDFSWDRTAEATWSVVRSAALG